MREGPGLATRSGEHGYQANLPTGEKRMVREITEESNSDVSVSFLGMNPSATV